jgi:hypothetical protein
MVEELFDGKRRKGGGNMQSLNGGYLARLNLNPGGVWQALVSRIIFG